MRARSSTITALGTLSLNSDFPRARCLPFRVRAERDSYPSCRKLRHNRALARFQDPAASGGANPIQPAPVRKLEDLILVESDLAILGRIGLQALFGSPLKFANSHLRCSVTLEEHLPSIVRLVVAEDLMRLVIWKI